MTKRQVWRYRCDFCKKSGCSGGHLAAHERSCTANPNRVCRMCPHNGEPQVPLLDLLAVIRSNGRNWDAAIKHLRDLTTCPACILSAMRQSGQLSHHDGEGFFDGIDTAYDYKSEVVSFWAQVNEDRGGDR